MYNEERYRQNVESFLNGDISRSKVFFAKNGYALEAAYCKLLSDDLKNAKQLFLKLKDTDNRANWGYKIIEIFQNKGDEYVYYDKMPTYFQLRNFLEVDLNILITYNKGDYVQMLCAYSDIFAEINAESYKFFARAFYFNNYDKFADYFNMKAKDKFYNDPELHYQIAMINYNRGNIDEAKKYCLSCLHILDEYYPAVKLLNKISISGG